MILYHGAYDLQMFYDWEVDVTRGTWKLFQIAIAGLFLAVSGISAGFWATSDDALSKGWRRGWKILSLAMVLSLVTAIIDPETWICFGILHLIALSAFLLPLLRRLHPIVISLLGIMCIALQPFDLMPHVVSVDYVPPIPWLGPILLGFAAGIPIAKHGSIDRAPSLLMNLLALPGKYSLWVYLLHQPIIVFFLWLFFRVFG